MDCELDRDGGALLSKPTHFQTRDGKILMQLRERLLSGLVIPAHPWP